MAAAGEAGKRARDAAMTPRGKTVLSILALLAVAALGWWYWAFVYVPPDTIILRDDGWHPRTLTVPAGTTITFRSERGKYFWPASDFHPTHTLFPAFDPKKPIAPHDSWSFTFDKPGTYPFHDHLAAYYFGIIKVADANGKVDDNCMEKGELECWQIQLISLLADKGVQAVYDEIAKLYANPDFASNCHYIAHNLGLASYQFYRTDPSFIYAPNAIACAGGFYHGFMEGFIGATGDPKAAAKVCDEIGKRIGDVAPDARLQCYHGIGHGSIETYIATKGVLESAEDMVAAAVPMCEQASAGADERYRCVSGLYNGIANFYIDHEFGFSLSTSDPVKICEAQPDVYKDACYGNMNSVFKWETNNDFAKSAAIVLSIPDQKYRESALQYLAQVYAIDYLSTNDYAPMTKSCNALAEPYRQDCVVGFAHGLLEHGDPGEEYKQALAFCEVPGLGASDRAACYTHIIGSLPGWYSKEKAAQICAALPDALKKYCAAPQ